MTQPEAKQTPLSDLLEQVPKDIVLRIPGDEPMFPSHTNIPMGKLAHEAAAELRRLHQTLHDIYEIWAGSEDIPVPQTAPEAYLLKLIEQMRDKAKEGLK